MSLHRKVKSNLRYICNLKYKTPKKNHVVFHNGSTYFIIKSLVKEFEGHFECLRENAVKYTTFSVPIKKELDIGKTITYKLKFFDSFRSQPHYQNWLIIYVKFISKIVEIKTANLSVSLKGLKIGNFLIIVNNVEKSN